MEGIVGVTAGGVDGFSAGVTGGNVDGVLAASPALSVDGAAGLGATGPGAAELGSAGDAGTRSLALEKADDSVAADSPGSVTNRIGAGAGMATRRSCQAARPHQANREWSKAAAIALFTHTDRGVLKLSTLNTAVFNTLQLLIPSSLAARFDNVAIIKCPIRVKHELAFEALVSVLQLNTAYLERYLEATQIGGVARQHCFLRQMLCQSPRH